MYYWDQWLHGIGQDVCPHDHAEPYARPVFYQGRPARRGSMYYWDQWLHGIGKKVPTKIAYSWVHTANGRHRLYARPLFCESWQSVEIMGGRRYVLGYDVESYLSRQFGRHRSRRPGAPGLPRVGYTLSELDR